MVAVVLINFFEVESRYELSTVSLRSVLKRKHHARGRIPGPNEPDLRRLRGVVRPPSRWVVEAEVGTLELWCAAMDVDGGSDTRACEIGGARSLPIDGAVSGAG